ncbi:MAG: PEP-CTERM sorting domain-containing protein [Pirellulaceae bacterium]
MTQSTITRDPASLFRPTPSTRHRRGSLSVFRLVIMASVLAISSQALPVHAQFIGWNNPTNSNAWFENPLNWTPNALPGPGNSLIFSTGGAYHVLWNPNTSAISPTVLRLYVEGGENVTFANVNPAQQYQLEVLGENFGECFEVSNSSTLTLNGLHLLARRQVYLKSGVLNINGLHPAGSRLTSGGNLRVSFSGALNVTGPNAVVSSVNGIVGDNGSGQATVSGIGAQWNNSGSLFVGDSTTVGTIGTLDVLDGGVVTSTNTRIGDFISSTGFVTVSGSGSQLQSSGALYLGFQGGNGTMNVESGGLVTNTDGFIGYDPFGQTGTSCAVTVTGGSRWDNSASLYVGHLGTGTLNVEEAGVVTSTNGFVGHTSGSTGTVTVTGAGSKWAMSGLLNIGVPGTGTLNVNDGGLVTVGTTTSIGTNGAVTMGGGRFEFGTTSLASFGRIGGTSGSLAGTVNHAGYTNVASLIGLQNPSLDMTDVNLVNSGGFYGNAVLGTSLTNTSSGEVETDGNERMRFAGSGTNAGKINIFGGQVRFAGNFVNEAGGEVKNFDHSFIANHVRNEYDGFIWGRGQFVANTGWYNAGVMAFSDGSTDIVGDVYNSEGATIVTSGNGTTTFYDDFYQENAGTVRTSAGSSTVFFGEVSGAGSFVGEGTVFLEGDLRPGNSPGTMSFGGDLVLSSSASTMIELGGLGLADFDRLLIGGDLFLGDSSLNVFLWDSFVLGSNMQFLFADVDGDLFGQFNGLSEGSLVGNFGGTDLFITYEGFGGNQGIGLFTAAVPEPSSVALISLLGCSIAYRRRRSRDLH